MIPDETALAARLKGCCALGELAGADKVIVRDLVLSARLGVWKDEKNKAQKVRFTVELYVERKEEPPRRLKDVISYDFIIEGIKTVLSRGHTQLTEQLAEQIAHWCLEDKRAIAVRVVVEKLDRVPGASLGCEILRRREDFAR